MNEKLILCYAGLSGFIACFGISVVFSGDMLKAVFSGAIGVVVACACTRIFLRVFYSSLETSLAEKAQEIPEEDDTSPLER